MTALSPAGREQIATASELVRQFGVWQDRAALAPVYILHRGRPRYVLTTVDLMETLCAPHTPAEAAPGTLDAATILDRGHEAIVAADAALRITAISRAARLLLGEAAVPGSMLAGLAGPDIRPLFLDAVRRAIARGRPGEVDIPCPRDPARPLAIAIEPVGDGVALFVTDRAMEEEHDAALAERRGYDAALVAIRGAARARINLRGYLADPSDSLAEWTGVSAAALAQVRFVSLFDIADRVGVGDALDAAIAVGEPRTVGANLLVNRGDPAPVRIGLAPLRTRLAVVGVAAIMVRRDD